MERQLNYPGDCRSIIGQVVGPTLLGQWLTIIATDYDEQANLTTAHVRPSTVKEVENRRTDVAR